jgi:hypothetical protein
MYVEVLTVWNHIWDVYPDDSTLIPLNDALAAWTGVLRVSTNAKQSEGDVHLFSRMYTPKNILFLEEEDAHIFIC